MPIQTKRLILGAIAAMCSACLSQTAPKSAGAGDSSLKEHIEAAQRLQQSGKLDQAAEQYRAFLADAMSKLANWHAKIGEYGKAASFFDEALAIEPDSPRLRLDYASTALIQGDFSRVETLTKAFLKDYPRDRQGLAQAHQLLGRALLKMSRDQDARKELEAAVALDPSFENGYDLAVVCLDQDDEKCASQIFGEMETSFGDTPQLHMSIGRAYGDSDFAPKAVIEFKKAIAENPRFPGAHYSLAAAFLDAGEDEAAVQTAENELKKELEVSPHDFLTYAALGKIESSKHQYADAEKYLKQAVSLNPKSPDAFLYLGQMYFDTERFAEAKDDLRRAIDLTTDESRNHFQVQKAHFLLGRILMQEHHQDEAHAEMQIARAIGNRGLSQDKRKLAGTLSNGAGTIASADSSADSMPAIKMTAHEPDPDAIRGLNDFEKRLSPAIADSYNNLGVIAATGSDYIDALRYFEKTGEWNPSLEGLDLNWGRAAFMASRFADAIAPLSRYLRSHPDDGGIRGALSLSKFMTGDYSGCVETIGGEEAKIASIPQMEYAYADSLVRTGQVSSGIDRLQSLAAQHPEIAEVHKALGEALELRGERQKAANEIQEAIRLNANDGEAHYDLGAVDLESGDALAAIRELEIAIRIQPGDARSHRELSFAYKAALRPADAEKELRIYESLLSSSAQPTASRAITQDTSAPK